MTLKSNSKIIGVLLAGGLSRRMFAGQDKTGEAKSPATAPVEDSTSDRAQASASGLAQTEAQPRDKCLELLDERPMLAHVIARLAPQVHKLVLNANGDPARFKAFDLPVVADPVEGFAGPLAGVLAGMRWTQQHHRDVSHIVTVSTDAPFLPRDLVARFMKTAAQAAPGAIVIASSGGNRQPVIGLWPLAHADDLQDQLQKGVRKVLQWTDRHGTVLCDFAMTTIGGNQIDPFFNANHPDELIEARRLLQLGA